MSFGALARSKSVTFVLFLVLIFAIVYQVHRNELINRQYAKYLGFGTTDPWDIHGSSEKRDAKPTERRYEQRREHLRQTCQNFPTDSFVKQMEKNITTYEDMVVDEERQILFCGVPKSATTIWKRMFLKMEFPRFANVPLEEVRSGKDGKLSTTKGQDLKTLKDYSISERKRIFDTYYKFLVVRPPFERLLSAFRDKSDRLAYSFFNGKVMDSLKERDMADEYIYFDVESFHQFLEFIIARTPYPLSNAGEIALEANTMLRNEMPIFDLCHPCSVEYDFIGKFETLEQDMNYITKKIKMPVAFPYHEPTTNADYMRLYYHGVKVEHLNVLKTLYHKDFEMFEYKIPQPLISVGTEG